MIPIDPNWLIEALGTLEIDPTCLTRVPIRIPKTAIASDPHDAQYARRTEH